MSEVAKVEKKRVEYLDIAKGIGVVMVVWAHAKAPEHHYMYKFLMPMFFIISGYLYSSKGTIKQYVIRKLQSLWIPYVSWNLLMYLARHLNDVTPDNIGYVVRYCIGIIFTMEKDGEFFGATWFLGALLFVSIAYKLVDACLEKVPHRRIWVTLVFIGITILGFMINLPHMQSRTMVISIFFAIGTLFKEYETQFRKWFIFHGAWKHIVAWAGMIFFVVSCRKIVVNMGTNEYSHKLLFIVGAVLGSYFFIYLSRQLELAKGKAWQPVKKVCVYLGKRSLDIVIWQFVAFKLVMLVQLYLTGEPYSDIFRYLNKQTDHGWWLAYLIVGTVVPLIWCNFLRLGWWGKILKKLHMV